MVSDWETQSETHKAFMKMLKPYLEEFTQKMSPYRIEGLIPKSPRELAIFKDVHGKCEPVFDTVYKIPYSLSFAAYAQAHRHRTIRYSINLAEYLGFYVPEILREVGLDDEWLKDILSIKDVFPQGMLVWVVESGEISDFVSKCYERCCGRAQLEIQIATNINLVKFRRFGTEQAKKIIDRDIGEGTAACTFPYHKCTEGCKFGAKQFYRKI